MSEELKNEKLKNEKLKNEGVKGEKSIQEENKIKEENNSNEKQETIQDMMNSLKEIIEKLEKGFKCEFDNPENPTALLIYDKDKNLVAAISKEKGLYTNVPELANEIAKLLSSGKLSKGVINLLKGEKNTEEQKENASNKTEKTEEEKKEEKDESDKELADEDNEKSEDDEKNENENEGELTKEEIQEQLGDKYVVAEVINDEEISRALIGSEGFTGNPMIAFNKEEKKFEIVGNKSGKLERAKLPTMPTSSGKVKRYNYNGSVINEEKGNVSNELLLINSGKDGLELGVNEYGEIILNKQLNVNDINQESRVSVPVDTNQKVPSTQEIQEMKVKSKQTDMVNQKLDEMEKEGKIGKIQRRDLEKQLAKNGSTPEEDLEYLENYEQNAEQREGNIKQEEVEKGEEEPKGKEEPKGEEELDDSWIIYGKPRSH